ncbi:SGNH/GDSL hydrolase family protein [Coraliomargarita sp. SDUM461003]|uniref:SGNH/GDSL hydrolase family protein n=1 Tax=Thalassobacterium maritimum TaxID=3041265 RepID=A0ABU1AXT2_9BACT|nr:SGNH/GDSL hydrolase family protein [Coraliomargarita sp. SDUM461003]MDQ8208896.1 SGNH/GDSL hydrolase family protein [Coraliomargarita sp. SDUM461003]
MRRLRCLIASSALVCITTWAQAENKVLFIGNSYTFGAGGTQSVPDIFDALANAGGQEDPTTVMRAVGGKDYKFHYENSSEFIQQEAWTHVILQNYSTQPTHIKNTQDHFDYGTRLYQAIVANNADTQVMLYMTWARAEAHSLISGKSTPKSFASTNEMLEELRSNYYALAEQLSKANPDKLPTVVNPVGLAWKAAGGNLPADAERFIDLFDKDKHHGNDRGYYLSACVHYACIYQASPEGLFTQPEVRALELKISAEEAALLEKAAWETVSKQN